MGGDIDLEALVRTLREHPQRLEELRRLLLPPEESDVRASLAALAAAQERTEGRLARLTERVDALAERVDALAERVDALAEQMSSLTERVDALAEQMSSLAEQVSSLAGHVSWLRGDALERRYREKGHAYLSSIARRLRSVSPDDLEGLLEEAVEGGTLSVDEAQQVRLLDAVFRGRREGADCYLAVEVSVGVGIRDVTRARERADLLARTGSPAVAVVAGEWINPEAADAARAMAVWQVTNGRATGPAG